MLKQFDVKLYLVNDKILVIKDTNNLYDIISTKSNEDINIILKIKTNSFLGILNIEDTIYRIFYSNINTNIHDKQYYFIKINLINNTNSSILLYRIVKYCNLYEYNKSIKSNIDIYNHTTDKDLLTYSLNEPYYYHLHTKGKNIRKKYIDTLCKNISIDTNTLNNLIHIINIAHNSSLLIDDIQDKSIIRRGTECAYIKYGIPLTLNSAYMLIFNELSKIKTYFKYNQEKTLTLIIDSLLILHEGQGMDIFWRDYKIYPTQKEYIEMIAKKTAEPFILITKLVLLHTNSYITMILNYFLSLEYKYTSIARKCGIYFQINDDYINIVSNEYSKSKGLYDDLHERKYSFLIVYIINQKKEGYQDLINLFEINDNLTDIQIEECVQIIKNTDAIKYTNDFLLKLKKDILTESNNSIELKWFFDKIEIKN